MKIKRLYSIGDSWTNGHELENPITECYPYLLAQRLGCELVNDALPAASNDWMFRKTVEWICKQENTEDCIVIVGWSIPSRREENFKFYYGGPPEWERKLIDKENKISHLISDYLYNHELITIRTLVYIFTLQEVLKSKNIKYLFYQPWVDILIEDDWYEKNDKKDISTYSNRLNEVYTNIDKKFVVGPEFKNSKGYNSYKIAFEEMRHPNKSEQEVISKFIEEKIVELYYD